MKNGLSIIELEDRHELSAGDGGCCSGRCSGNDTDVDVDVNVGGGFGFGG
ncbi:hypothetical protein [Aquimarina rhabdastrellae]